MVILLSGSTKLGRAAIGSRLIKEDAMWRHLPMEELEEMEHLKQIEGDERESILLRVACQCALQMEEDGFHLLISCDYTPAAALIAVEELGDRVAPVHVGPPEEIERSTFPHQLSSNATVADAYAFLMSLTK